MANHRIPNRDRIIADAIEGIRHNVAPSVIAARYGIHDRTIRHWLQWHPQAYQARISAIANLPFAHGQEKKRAWHVARLLSRLSLYRQANPHIKPRPHPKWRPDDPRRKVNKLRKALLEGLANDWQ